jgi:hypothetical protein
MESAFVDDFVVFWPQFCDSPLYFALFDAAYLTQLPICNPLGAKTLSAPQFQGQKEDRWIALLSG